MELSDFIMSERIEHLAMQCRERNLQFDIYTTHKECPDGHLFTGYLGMPLDEREMSWSDVVKGNSLEEIITQLEEVYDNITIAPFTD